MPLYEYKCDKCGNLFEVMQKFSDEPLKTHENCGGMVHRLLSAPALQFKGSGWYITDYAKGGGANKPAAGANESNGKPKAESSSSKGDSSSSSTTSTSSSSSDKK